jgi:hypothetical protein|tara:strand:+ start:1011 stop:1298 length:288 start_codon:yes stop_codon:yes gene_type:complete
MAITKTTLVQRCEVYPAGDSTAENTLSTAWPTIMVVYEDHIDDVSDDDLPVVATRVKHLAKFTVTVDSDGVESSEATVVSGEDTLVQTICTAVWS